MRALFMGTPRLAAGMLEALAESHEVVGVFTRPDAVRGRGRALVASPVKEAALERGIPVHEAADLTGPGAVEAIASLAPDVICVAAYGCLLPEEILRIPALGCLNVHTSLLPRWRGAAPIERAILAGDEETGVCVMRMEEGLDTGPYCVCRKVPVGECYLQELTDELGKVGAEALLEALRLVESGGATWTEQAAEGVLYAGKVEKGELDFGPEETARAIVAKVRAASDSRPAKAAVAGKTLSVERARIVRADELPGVGELESGQAAMVARRLVIGAADGAIELSRVKPDGKKSMEGTAFAAGLQGIRRRKAAWGRA